MKEVILGSGLLWVLSVLIFPMIGTLWLWFHRTANTLHERVDRANERVEKVNGRIGDANEQLAAYKLDVAKQYASIAYLKDVERRLTSHLVRIENKLDEREKEKAG